MTPKRRAINLSWFFKSQYVYNKVNISQFVVLFRTSSHGEETLDDVFNTPSRAAFTTTEDDDDLFKQTSAVEESSVQDMSADDIASYIQQNTPGSNVKLDLF